MKKVAAFGILCGCLALGVPMRAEEPSPEYKHLEFLEPTIGVWTLDADWGSQGKVIGELRREWVFNKSCIKEVSWFKVANQPRVDTEGYTRWDPIRKVLVTSANDSQGGFTERIGSYDPASKLLKSDQVVIGKEGKFTGTVTQEQVSPNLYRVRFTDVHKDDQPLPDINAAFTRAKGVPQEALEEMKYLVGDWSFEGRNQEGEAFKGTCTYRWTPGKHCLFWDQTWVDKKGTTHQSGLTAWDPARGQLVDCYCFDEGNFIIEYHRFGPDGWTGGRLAS